jgi:hypothetical protein
MLHRLLLTSIFLLAALPAQAQSQPQSAPPVQPPPNFSATANQPRSDKPVVSAVAYSPISRGSSFETQANDDTEIDQEALNRVNAVLAERGYTVAETAPYVMVVEADLIRGQRQDNPLGRAYANNDGARIDGRLFSTTQNSLLNPNPPADNADRIYRISLSVYDRASGLYVWRGSANRNDPNLDINQASAEMVTALLTHLGQTVKPATH